ncbi:MAG: ABC transporter permease [Fimbriimonadaceae bacterium]
MGKSYLTESHAERIRIIPGVKDLAKFSFVGGGVSRGDNEAFPLIIAVDSSWFRMHELDFLEGKRFDEKDEGLNVCVLGGVAKATLFPNESAENQTIFINGEGYKIIGVTEDKGQEQSPFSMQSLSNVAYIPLSTIQSTQDNVQIDRIFIETEPNYNPESLIANIESVLAKSSFQTTVFCPHPRGSSQNDLPGYGDSRHPRHRIDQHRPLCRRNRHHGDHVDVRRRAN